MIKKCFIIILMLTVMAGCGAKDLQPKEDNRREQLINDLLEEYGTEEDPEEDIQEDQEDIAEEKVEVVVEPEGPKCPLTGLPYDGEYKPVAMMIENSPAARPQSGVINADLVYEAHAEGGITRFLAIFLSESPEVVGPNTQRPALLHAYGPGMGCPAGALRTVLYCRGTVRYH